MVARDEQADVELAIGGALPVEDWGETDAIGITCKLCGQQVVPHPMGGLFTVDEPWWVCDTCAARHAPALFALVKRLRTVSGDAIVRPVTNWERFDEYCPECREPHRFFESDRWSLVSADTDKPWCRDCIARLASSDVRQLLSELNALK